jgi:ATP-binding cassette subfamily B protein
VIADVSRTLRATARGARAAVRLAAAAGRRELAGTAVLEVLAALLPVGVVLAGRAFVDAVLPSYDSSAATAAAVALGVLVAASRAAGPVRAHRETVLGEAVAQHAEAELLDVLARVEYARFDRSDWYDTVRRATRDLGWRPAQAVTSAVGLLGAGVTLAGLAGLVGLLDPVLLGLLLLALLPPVVAQRRVNVAVFTFWQRHTEDERRQAYLRELASHPRPAKDVRAYGLAAELVGRFRVIGAARVAALRRVHRQADVRALLGGAVSGALLVLAFLRVGSRARAGAYSAGDVTLVVGALAAMVGQLGALLTGLVALEQHLGFLDDYFALVAQRPPPSPVEAPVLAPVGVEVRDVTFTFHGASAPVLRGVSLRVAPGEIVAVTGGNGSGKSTLVKLLAGLYAPDSGSVTIGGVEPAAARERVGVLFQDFAAFELSVGDNVAFGRVGAPVDAAAALAAVGLDRLGVDDAVGRVLPGAHDLSGGEWQRLALARLLARDADVWVLDEPTAALDAEAEERVVAELRRRLAGRAALLVSHRPAALALADRVLVLRDGRLTEAASLR